MKLPIPLDESVFVSPVQLLLCTSKEHFDAAMKMYELHPADPDVWVTKGSTGTMRTFERDDGQTYCLVCVDIKPDHTNTEIVGIIVHEAVHVHQKICEIIGERYPSDEFQAYNIQWLTQCLLCDYVRQVKG